MFSLRGRLYLIVAFLHEALSCKKATLPQSHLFRVFFITLTHSALLMLSYFLCLMALRFPLLLYASSSFSSSHCLLLAIGSHWVSCFRALYFFFTIVFCFSLVSLICFFSAKQANNYLCLHANPLLELSSV